MCRSRCPISQVCFLCSMLKSIPQIRPPPPSQSDTGGALPGHRHSLRRRHRRRHPRPERHLLVLSLESGSDPSDQEPGRRAGPAAHPVQRHRAGLLPIQDVERADGAAGRRRGAGQAVAQRPVREAGGYCGIGCVPVQSSGVAYKRGGYHDRWRECVGEGEVVVIEKLGEIDNIIY